MALRYNDRATVCIPNGHETVRGTVERRKHLAGALSQQGWDAKYASRGSGIAELRDTPDSTPSVPMKSMLSPPCYFYHIPKTAGMSSWQLIEWLYPEDKICPGRMWEDIINLPMDVMKTYDAFRGHFLAYLEPYLGRKLTTFTVLRDPVERTISHYYHVQRAPEHPFHTEARALSLADFCTHPRTRHMVQNYQAGYLACPGRKDPRELARTMTKDDLAAYKLQLALDPSPDEFPARDELYRAASTRLRSFTAVGITERLQESFGLIARQLGGPHPPEFGRRNVGANRTTALDGHTIRIVRQCTDIDQALYADQLKQFEDNLDLEEPMI